MEIIRGKIPSAKKVVIYGPEGIGKSTFASRFPEPLFIDTEGSTKDIDVARTPSPSSWSMLMEQVSEIKRTPGICKTLIIDTADWAEMLCIEKILAQYHKSGIEEFGYGKGYTYVQEEFGRLLNLLEEVIAAGIHVVLTAHAKVRKFEQPDELGSYDRWEMKLTKQTAPMVKEWADMVLFANYKTIVVNVDGQGAQKGKNKAQGGKRVMYTAHHNCWDAKNRYALPEEMAFDYESIRPVIKSWESPLKAEPSVSGSVLKQPSTTPGKTPPPTAGDSAREVSAADKSIPEPVKTAENVAAAEQNAEPAASPSVHVDERIPKNLRDLMIANGVDEWDMQNVVEARGYVPTGTPIWQYEEVNPGLIDGVLVAAWDQVFAIIQKMKEKDSLVFN